MYTLKIILDINYTTNMVGYGHFYFSIILLPYSYILLSTLQEINPLKFEIKQRLLTMTCVC